MNIPGSPPTACSDEPSPLWVGGGGIVPHLNFKSSHFAYWEGRGHVAVSISLLYSGLSFFCCSFNPSSCHLLPFDERGIRGVWILQNCTDLRINTVQNNLRKLPTALKLPENFYIPQTAWFCNTAISQLKIKFLQKRAKNLAKQHHPKPLRHPLWSILMLLFQGQCRLLEFYPNRASVIAHIQKFSSDLLLDFPQCTQVSKVLPLHTPSFPKQMSSHHHRPALCQHLNGQEQCFCFKTTIKKIKIMTIVIK